MGLWGTNLQNYNESLADCLIADPGKKIIHCDQAGAEALIVAHEAPRGKFIRLIELGIKPHVYMALQIFIDHFVPDRSEQDAYYFADPDDLAKLSGWPELKQKIAHSGSMYALGKKTIHAKNYDMKWPTFKDSVTKDTEGQIVLSNEEARRYLQLHSDLFPEIIVWQNLVAGQAEKTRVIRNLFGYPRVISQMWGSKTRRAILSFIPQSTVGVITHLAFTDLNRYIQRTLRPWDLLLNKHDSIDMQVPEEDEEEACVALKEALSRELTATDGHQFRMKAELQTGWNLGAYDAEENPRGLKEYD